MIKILADKNILDLDLYLRDVIVPNEYSIHYIDDVFITNESLADYEILLIRSTTKINESLLVNSNIKFIGSATAGINHIDTNYLTSNNIYWDYAPGCNSSAVTHYVLAAVAQLLEINKLNYDSKIGIIGYGNIGKKVSYYLKLLGFEVFINDPLIDDNNLVDLNTVLRCDLISLHIPFTERGKYKTHNLINENELALLNNKILINTSRGGIVNEKALLAQDTICYIADVWENEPTPSKQIVDKALISTPHIAGYSKEGKINGTKMIVAALVKYFEEIKITNPFLFKDPSLRINNNFTLNKNLIEPMPLYFYNKSLDIKSLSDEMKFSFKKTNSKNISKIFAKLRQDHPLRNDFDSIDL